MALRTVNANRSAFAFVVLQPSFFARYATADPGADPLRFYLASIMPESKDADWNWTDFITYNNSVLLAKFMNMVMERGKKSTAEKIVYGAIERIAERTNRPADQAVALLQQALDNVKPAVEVKSRRVGGATYQVPVEVRTNRRQTLAMRWVIEAARGRSEKSMAQRLAHELLEAAENRGSAVRKREDTHRMADANKAFAHYRW